MAKSKKKSLSYEKAGVPHLKGDDRYNDRIKELIRSTHIPGVAGDAMGFASMFDLSATKIKDPMMITATDGVGTKLELALLQKKHDTIGIDLVAMCVNDLITTGGKPLVFLDYFATGKFDAKTTFEVLKGVVKGCRDSGCALVGGETAIMPGFYESTKGSYDVAGFAVGVVSKKKRLTGKSIKKGDALLAIESSGFHSNGFSLLRKIYSKKELSGPVGRKLLKPTTLYVKPVLEIMNKVDVKGVCNITGGGVYDNLPRILPKKFGAVIDSNSWKVPKLFRDAQERGNVSEREMFRTFNMGVGMVLVIDPKNVYAAQKVLKKYKLKSWQMGEVTTSKKIEVV